MCLKQVFAFILLCAFMSKANAQSKLRFGIKAGMNFPTFNATVKKPVIDHLQQEPWFYAGIQSQIRFSKSFSLQPELFWVSNRAQVYLNSPSAIREEDLDQLSLPILAKYHLGKVSFYAGPQFDFLLDAKQRKNDITDSYKKIAINATVGIEWVFRYRFGIDARYVFGLSNMAAANAESDITSQPGQSLKISTAQAGLFFRFGRRSNGKG